MVKFFKIYEKLLKKAKENCEIENEYDKYSWIRTSHLIQIYNDCTKKYVYEVDINSIISEAKKMYLQRLDKSLDKYDLINKLYGDKDFIKHDWCKTYGVKEDLFNDLLRDWLRDIKKSIDYIILKNAYDVFAIDSDITEYCNNTGLDKRAVMYLKDELFPTWKSFQKEIITEEYGGVNSFSDLWTLMFDEHLSEIKIKSFKCTDDRMTLEPGIWTMEEISRLRE